MTTNSSAASSAALLASLQRLDPQVSGVLLKTSYVMRYQWDPNSCSWVKDKLEGPFVLAERAACKDYAVCVLNRLAPVDAFQVFPRRTSSAAPSADPQLEYEIEVSIQSRFVFYRLRGDIFALWFSSADLAEMDAVASAFKQHLGAVQLVPQPLFASGDSPSPPPPPATGPPPPKDDENAPLSKEEFKDALISLICDDKFITLLHNEYVQARQQTQATPPAPPAPHLLAQQQQQQQQHMLHLQHQQQQQHYYQQQHYQQQQHHQQQQPFYPANASFAPNYTRPHYHN